MSLGGSGVARGNGGEMLGLVRPEDRFPWYDEIILMGGPLLTRQRLVFTVLLAGTIAGLISFNSVAFLFRAEDVDIPLFEPLIWEMTSNYTTVLLLPVIWWFFKRFPLKATALTRSLLGHHLGLLVFSGSHTLIMVQARRLIYHLLELEPYVYGAPFERAVMELSKDVFTYAGVMIIFSAVSWWRSSKEAQLKNAQLLADLRESELQTLRAQLDPHFLFNALNTVSDVMYQDVERADTILASLSRLLRFSLDTRLSRTHTLTQEFEVLELYLDVMRARFPDRLVVKTTMAREAAASQVPIFILQPLVENSIKHHPRARGQTMEIRVTANPTETGLELTVWDNGPGPSQPLEQLRRRGVGLDHTLRRLEAMYGAEAHFSLAAVTGGCLARIRLPHAATVEGS